MAANKKLLKKIDIGIALIRAAAKNFKDTFCVSDKNDYEDFLNILTQSNGAPDMAQRKRYSVKAFQTSSNYDAAIFNHFNQQEEVLKLSVKTVKTLRYGENPHQKGQFLIHYLTFWNKFMGKKFPTTTFWTLMQRLI